MIKRCIVERNDKAEIRPEERSEKAESCRENLWNEIQLKGHKDKEKGVTLIRRAETRDS